MPYKDPKRNREYKRRWVAKRRAEWLADHGPCVKCGSGEDLEVNHRDPDLKVDHRIWSWSDDRRAAELAKCEVLCKRCHLAVTREQRLSATECRKGHLLAGDNVRVDYRGFRECVTCSDAKRRRAAVRRASR